MVKLMTLESKSGSGTKKVLLLSSKLSSGGQPSELHLYLCSCIDAVRKETKARYVIYAGASDKQCSFATCKAQHNSNYWSPSLFYPLIQQNVHIHYEEISCFLFAVKPVGWQFVDVKIAKVSSRLGNFFFFLILGTRLLLKASWPNVCKNGFDVRQLINLFFF